MFLVNYLDINVNSVNYYKLSKEDKLRCVKTKLNTLFNDKSGKTITIVYKGKKRTIPYDKQGIVKDLVVREKALEKKVSIPFEYDFEKEKLVKNNNFVSPFYMESGETIPLPGFFPFFDSDVNDGKRHEEKAEKVLEPASSNIVTFDELTLDEKIKVVKSKMFAIFDLSKKFKDDKKKIVKVSYKGEEKYIPYSLWGEYKNLKTLLEKLECDKRKNVINSKIIDLPNAIINKGTEDKLSNVQEKDSSALELNNDNNKKSEDEDLSDVWKNIFDKKGSTANKTLKYKVDKDGKFVTARIVSNEDDGKIKPNYEEKRLTVIEKSKKNKIGILPWLLGLPIVKKIKNRKKSGKFVGKTKIKGLFKKDKGGKYLFKKEKRGITSQIIAIPFIKKIVDKRKNKEKVSHLVDKEKNKRRKTAIVTWALVTSLLLSGIGLLGKNSNKNRNNFFKQNNDSATDVWEPTEENTNEIETETVKQSEPVVIETETVTPDVSNDDMYSFSFNDRVTIDDGASIYYSSNNAVNNENEFNPLFDGSYERSIDGIVYNLNGHIYTIYSTDVNAYEKAQDLINQGATEEALLVTRSDLRENHKYDNQYEGYYDIDDVKVLTRVRN